MKRKKRWPSFSQYSLIDSRLVPDIFSFKYPKSPWVRLLLAVEMFCAVGVVVGTLLLAVLAHTGTGNDMYQETIVAPAPSY